jgi:hypothetical protein
MSGFGLQAFGTSSAGAGSPLGLPTADAPETAGPLVAVRLLDPVAGDYGWEERDGALFFEAMSATTQRVLLAVGTAPGTVAGAPRFGNGALGLRVDDGRLEQAVLNHVRAALASLLSEGAIELLSVPVERTGSGLFFAVEFRDLATRRTQRTPLQPL